MFPQKVYGQRDLENTMNLTPLSENHNVLCLIEGPEKSYRKIVTAKSSNSQTVDHGNLILGFHLLRITQNPREHSLRLSIKTVPLTHSQYSILFTLSPLWLVFLYLTIHNEKTPQNLWTYFYNSMLFKEQSTYRIPPQNSGYRPCCLDEKRKK